MDGPALAVPSDVTVGGRFRLARSVAGKTQKQMAAALGMSLATYERTENGKRRIRRSEVIAAAQITGQDEAFFGASSGEGERVLTPPPLPVNADAGEGDSE